MSAPALLDSLPSVGQTIVVTFPPADAWSEPDHRTVLVLSRDGDSVDVRVLSCTEDPAMAGEVWTLYAAQVESGECRWEVAS